MRGRTAHDASVRADDRTDLHQVAARALWLLPVYSALLTLGTLTHQPDYVTDFPGYARYITTDVFLGSHIVASIVGAGIGTLGLVATVVFLAEGRSLRPAVVGVGSWVLGNAVATSVFGVAAFAQPAIGRAYLRQAQGIESLNNDVYGTPLVVTVSLGLLAMIVGAAMVGIALRRRDHRLRRAGTAYAVLTLVFVLAGFSVEILQPLAALGLVVVTTIVARRLPRLHRD